MCSLGCDWNSLRLWSSSFNFPVRTRSIVARNSSAYLPVIGCLFDLTPNIILLSAKDFYLTIQRYNIFLKCANKFADILVFQLNCSFMISSNYFFSQSHAACDEHEEGKVNLNLLSVCYWLISNKWPITWLLLRYTTLMKSSYSSKNAYHVVWRFLR